MEIDRSFRAFAIVAVALALGTSASAQPPAALSRTIFLDAGAHGFSVPSTVTHHPGFDRYYASDTGSPGFPAFVFGAGGGVALQVLPALNIDARAWNYNANTGLLEVCSYDAVSGGAGRGLIQAQIDGGGNLTGGTATLLASVPGLADSQTAPAFDPGANVLYSRSDSNTVNVVSRTDGTQVGTITLDFAAAGASTVPDDGIVFHPGQGWLGVLDSDLDVVHFFDLTGDHVGSSAVDIDITGTARRPGFANEQIFVFDVARNGWQGYGVAVYQAPLIQEIPTLSAAGFAALSLALMVAGGLMLRRRARAAD